ncbi:hypothetical protein [Cupriavidus sp. UYPR2.512]|uniref:hypothetical protein n=1 Tax=Cupriavidus sp. UYPR2.512 TaxID=1080187 RepID=UPI001E292E78|nr:hypothetical protein [Cupriavidus sp. UYPR2.512]
MGPMTADRRLLRRRLLAGFDAATRFPGVDAHRMAVADSLLRHVVKAFPLV